MKDRTRTEPQPMTIKEALAFEAEWAREHAHLTPAIAPEPAAEPSPEDELERIRRPRRGGLAVI